VQVSKEGIERLKAANELQAVVAERGIALKRKGRQLVASCPFHKEKTASFNVSPTKGLFHCFGCGAAGDVIGFVTKYDRVSFGAALEKLARRAGLDLGKLMESPSRLQQRTPVEALTPPPPSPGNGSGKAAAAPQAPSSHPPGPVLARVVEHYHRSFCEREDAQAYLIKRGITDTDLIQALKVGYADGSLLGLVPKDGQLRDQLVELGVITNEGRELLGGCIVVPIPDPLTGQWTNLYGRGVRTPRHCYLPGPLRGVLNFQAARTSDEVILTESIFDALSFHQAGIATAIPIYGTNGFTSDHLDLLKREGVKRVVLALDSDEAGRRATHALKGRLQAAGIAVRVASFPVGVKDANELLVSRNGDAGEAFREVLGGAAPVEPVVGQPAVLPPSAEPAPPCVLSPPLTEKADRRAFTLTRDGTVYHARVHSLILGRLRVTVKASRGEAFHVDSLDLYASRARTEFAKRAGKVLSVEASAVEGALLALLIEAEKTVDEKGSDGEEKVLPAMSESERSEALAFLKRPDLLDQVARDLDCLGYVGEETNKRLLYLVAVSRKLEDPLSAIVLSQSGAGKSYLTEVIEKLTPPEDVVLLTRLTPQSLYYTEPGFLDRKLVIVEERYGSMEADYSIRVLQSRKKLIAAAPVKDPQTGNMRTKVFMVEARAAFIEATTASTVNHENATRCFELQMDESEEQTRRIHERMSQLRTDAGLLRRQEAAEVARQHWNAQRLLESAPVVIPFAEKLSFPSTWLRTRRDYARFLNLIEVSAFLHQHQRDRSREGAIVASVADYEAAYALAGEVLRETLTDVKKPLREALQRIQGLAGQGEGPISRREIREALGVPDSTVRRWLAELVELEYLEANGGKQGKAARYVVTARAPKQELVVGLLRPEELRRKLQNLATSPNLATRGGGVVSR
jgi:DNA-binding transcriptional ArsR family regulator/5S rRNA maturation endonuclease (ribonuclease M5)